MGQRLRGRSRVAGATVGSIVTVTMALRQSDVEAAKLRSNRGTFREVVSVAVLEELASVEQLLIEAGMGGDITERQPRCRPIDPSTLALLNDVAQRLGVGVALLAQCCLRKYGQG